MSEGLMSKGAFVRALRVCIQCYKKHLIFRFGDSGIFGPRFCCMDPTFFSDPWGPRARVCFLPEETGRKGFLPLSSRRYRKKMEDNEKNHDKALEQIWKKY